MFFYYFGKKEEFYFNKNHLIYSYIEWQIIKFFIFLLKNKKLILNEWYITQI